MTQARIAYLIILALLVPTTSLAKTLFELGGGRLFNSHSMVKESYFDTTLLNAGLYYGLNSGSAGRGIYLGLQYASASVNQYIAADTQSSFTTNDILVALRGTFLTKELLSYTFAFTPASVGYYKVTGYSQEAWEGASYINKISFHPDIGSSSRLKIAASVVYYYGKFTNEDTLASSKTSFTRSFMIPAVDIIYRF